jgi:serine protease
VRKWIEFFLVVTILVPMVPFVSSASLDVFERKEVNAGSRGFVAGQVVVKFKSGVSDQAIDEVVLRHGCLVAYRSQFSATFVLQFPVEEAVEGMLNQFRGESVVEYAQASYVCSASWVPNDPLYSYQWHFDRINMEQAWDVASGGSSSIVVAVLDTGVAYEKYLVYKRV